MYFNKRYERSGTLFQGRYKAALIDTEPYFLHLSRYIHLNSASLTTNWGDYPYSSYKNYIGERNDEWLDPLPVLSFFKEAKVGNFKNFLSYKDFVEDFLGDSRDELSETAID